MVTDSRGCMVTVYSLTLVPGPVLLLSYLVNKDWTQSHKVAIYLVSVLVGTVFFGLVLRKR